MQRRYRKACSEGLRPVIYLTARALVPLYGISSSTLRVFYIHHAAIHGELAHKHSAPEHGHHSMMKANAREPDAVFMFVVDLNRGGQRLKAGWCL